MFYIDDYNSKTITNSLPKKDREALAKVKSEMDSKQLATFWYIAGVTIASNYEEVRELLLKYGYDVTNEEDAASAIADMLGTPKWTRFAVDFGNVVEETADDNIIELLKNSEESEFIAAIIAAAGAAIGGSLGLASSNKQLKASKENARAAMIMGITNVLAEKEKAKAERARAARESKSGVVWIVVSVIVVIGIIVAIIIYKRNKAKNAVVA